MTSLCDDDFLIRGDKFKRILTVFFGKHVIRNKVNLLMRELSLKFNRKTFVKIFFRQLSLKFD